MNRSGRQGRTLGQATAARSSSYLSNEEAHRVSPSSLPNLRCSCLSRAGGDEASRLSDGRQSCRSLSRRTSLHDDLDSGGVAEVFALWLVEVPTVPRRETLVDRYPGQRVRADRGREADSEQAQGRPASLTAQELPPRSGVIRARWPRRTHCRLARARNWTKTALREAAGRPGSRREHERCVGERFATVFAQLRSAFRFESGHV